MAAASVLAVAAPAAAQYGTQRYGTQDYRTQGNGTQGYDTRGYGTQGYDTRGYDTRSYDTRGYGNPNAGGSVGASARIDQLQARLQAGIRSGTISRSEARSIEPQLRQLMDLERRYSANGLTQWERQDLQQRIRGVRQQLQVADGGSRQYDQYGDYDDRYDQRYGQGYGRPDQRYDRGYDDRYDRRDQRYDRRDGSYGQGGPYQEVGRDCDRRGGLGGVIDGVLGRNDCNDGLRVGQRISGNLYSVPYEYRGRFRDGGGVYYRSDGRQIYQIDARSHTVVRVYDAER